MKLRYAIVFATDIARLVGFYRDALGLTCTTDPADARWVELDAGGAALAIHAIPDEIAAGIAIADPPVPREETPIKLSFVADDFDAALARLASHGAVMSTPHRSPSFSSCDGVDPEGNVFQIVDR